VQQRITLEPQQNRWLFALDLPVASATKDVVFAAGGSIEYRLPVMRKLLYTVTSRLPAAGALVSPEMTKPNAQYLQLPRTVSPKVRALAEGWRREMKRGDNDIVNAGLEYFRTGNFAYTLSPGTYLGADPLEEFLFERRRGFCEHFAASFATLMRLAGVPSRVVLGYQGGRLNWVGSHLTILQSDAHAWCEVWLPGRGWRRIDPTAMVAPDRVNLGAESYNALSQMGDLSATERLQQLFWFNNPTGLRWFTRNISMAWDTIDMQWNLRVLGFNFEAQGDLMRDLGFGRFGMFGGAMGILLGLGIGAGTFAFFLFLRSRSHVPSSARASALAKLYATFCRKIARAGGPRRAPHEGPLDFAARATLALPANAPEIERITQLYVDGRYRRESGQIEAEAGDLRKALRSFHPRREKETKKNLVSSAPIRG
jgi:protein-glutamine gamma-glutamyltransferase